jgi:hypothetical protein
MRKEFRKEWARLNPVFVRREDDAMQTVLHAIQETLHGFFAPILMLGWIIKSEWKSLLNRKRS